MGVLDLVYGKKNTQDRHGGKRNKNNQQEGYHAAIF